MPARASPKASKVSIADEAMRQTLGREDQMRRRSRLLYVVAR